jgi:hypothetical protein
MLLALDEIAIKCKNEINNSSDPCKKAIRYKKKLEYTKNRLFQEYLRKSKRILKQANCLHYYAYLNEN